MLSDARTCMVTDTSSLEREVQKSHFRAVIIALVKNDVKKPRSLFLSFFAFARFEAEGERASSFGKPNRKIISPISRALYLDAKMPRSPFLLPKVTPSKSRGRANNRVLPPDPALVSVELGEMRTLVELYFLPESQFSQRTMFRQQ